MIKEILPQMFKIINKTSKKFKYPMRLNHMLPRVSGFNITYFGDEQMSEDMRKELVTLLEGVVHISKIKVLTTNNSTLIVVVAEDREFETEKKKNIIKITKVFLLEQDIDLQTDYSFPVDFKVDEKRKTVIGFYYYQFYLPTGDSWKLYPKLAEELLNHRIPVVLDKTKRYSDGIEIEFAEVRYDI